MPPLIKESTFIVPFKKRTRSLIVFNPKLLGLLYFLEKSNPIPLSFIYKYKLESLFNSVILADLASECFMILDNDSCNILNKFNS